MLEKTNENKFHCQKKPNNYLLFRLTCTFLDIVKTEYGALQF